MMARSEDDIIRMVTVGTVVTGHTNNQKYSDILEGKYLDKQPLLTNIPESNDSI